MPRFRWPLSQIAAAAVTLLIPIGSALAQTATPSKVEEDIRIRLGLPDEFGKEGVKGGKEINDAIISFRSQNLEQTLRDFNSAREANRSLPTGRVLLAKLLASINRLDLARLQLEVAAAERDSKGELVNDPEVYLTLGRLALAEGRLTDALLEFEKALSLVVGSGSSDKPSDDIKPVLREIYAGLTNVYEQRGDWRSAHQTAIVWVSNAGEQDKPQAHLRLGRAIFMSGDKDADNLEDTIKAAEEQFKIAYDADQALAASRAAKADKPEDRDNPDATRTIDHPKVALAVLCAQRAGNDTNSADYKKFHPRVEPYFNEAIADAGKESKVQQAKVHAAYSVFLRNENKMDAAEAQATKAGELDPSSDALKQLRAAIFLSRKNFDDAEREFRDMYRKSPSNFFASNGLVLSLIGKNSVKADTASLREAQDIAEMNARAFGQRSAEALATLGWVYFNNNNVRDAAQVLQAAVQGTQGQISPDTAFYLANVYAEIGQLDRAIELLDGAIRFGGNFLYRQEAQEWLDLLRRKPSSRYSPRLDPLNAPPAGAPGGGAAAPPRTPANPAPPK